MTTHWLGRVESQRCFVSQRHRLQTQAQFGAPEMVTTPRTFGRPGKPAAPAGRKSTVVSQTTQRQVENPKAA